VSFKSAAATQEPDEEDQRSSEYKQGRSTPDQWIRSAEVRHANIVDDIRV